MKTKITWLMIVAVAVIALSFYGGHEYFRANADIMDLNESFHTDAVGLLNEFVSNDTLATKKYLGRIIVVKGKLNDLEKDEKGYYTLVLGEDGIMSSIRCSMDANHNQEASTLKKGMFISVKGELTGYNADGTGLLGSDVVLNRCAVKNQE